MTVFTLPCIDRQQNPGHQVLFQRQLTAYSPLVKTEMHISGERTAHG